MSPLQVQHLQEKGFQPEVRKLDEAGFSAGRRGWVAIRMRHAQREWADTPMRQRLKLVRRLRQHMANEALTLARSSAALRSRPVAECLSAEVLPLLEACSFLERRAKSLLRPRHLSRWRNPLWMKGNKTRVERQPLGLVLIVGPSNYPLFLPAAQMLQALVAGNAVLVKPAPGASDPMNCLKALLLETGWPDDLVTILPESPLAVREALARGVDKVVLTGSASTGTRVMSQMATRLIPATMELSGCDAMFIREDADVDMAARALAFGLRLNNGATCMAPRRAIIHTRRQEELIRSLNRHLSPTHTWTLPQNRSSAWHDRIQRALENGARLVVGGWKDKETLELPLVFADMPQDVAWAHDESEVPVCCLMPVSDDDESLAANERCPYALSATIFTADTAAAERLASRLPVGVVLINDLIVPTADPRLPFGGRHQSGFGVTRGEEGLLEMTAPKVISRSPGRFRPHFDPVQAGDETWMNSFLLAAHGRGAWARIKHAIQAMKRMAQKHSAKNPSTKEPS